MAETAGRVDQGLDAAVLVGTFGQQVEIADALVAANHDIADLTEPGVGTARLRTDRGFLDIRWCRLELVAHPVAKTARYAHAPAGEVRHRTIAPDADHAVVVV